MHWAKIEDTIGTPLVLLGESGGCIALCFEITVILW